MESMIHLDLTEKQRQILIRGLRFVRSSRMLEFRDQTELTEEERTAELAEIRRLMDQLDRSSPRSETISV